MVVKLARCGEKGAPGGAAMSAAAAAARPVPSAPSIGGGGVFSRCFMGSGAAGAAGLYGRGAGVSFWCCWAPGDPVIGGGGGGMALGVAMEGEVDAAGWWCWGNDAGSDWELRVWPFW